jgi:hypothetical protein
MCQYGELPMDKKDSYCLALTCTYYSFEFAIESFNAKLNDYFSILMLGDLLC